MVPMFAVPMAGSGTNEKGESTIIGRTLAEQGRVGKC